MKKQVIKVKRPKRRIPVAPPAKRHKSERDYDRKKSFLASVCDVCENSFPECICDDSMDGIGEDDGA